MVLQFTYLRAQESAGKRSDNAMTSLVSKHTAAESTGYCSHKTTIALLACSRIGGAILVLLMGVWVVGVLRWGVLVVSSLLGELLRWIALGVLAAALGQHVCSRWGIAETRND